MSFVRINNSIIDTAKVSAIWQDERDVSKVTVLFDNGKELVFVGQEAMDIWRELDTDKGWKSDT